LQRTPPAVAAHHPNGLSIVLTKFDELPRTPYFWAVG